MNLKLLYYTALSCVWEYNSQSAEFKKKIIMLKKYVIGMAAHPKMMTVP